jgi:CarboxypepD_reg-like domain
MIRKGFVVGALLLFFSTSVFSQKVIRGFVIDSTSFAPLGYVNIKIKNTFRGTSSDSKGGFSISTARGDSLVFSLVGYNTEEFSAAELEETVIIRMAVQVRELEAITIIGHKDKSVKAIHLTPKSNLMNYTPYGAGVNLAYFTKLEKEKRKLKLVQAENERIKNYVAVVCSPDVRERICREFGISDDEYYQILAKFNIENMDLRYDVPSEELITILRQYYSSNVIKR